MPRLKLLSENVITDTITKELSVQQEYKQNQFIGDAGGVLSYISQPAGPYLVSTPFSTGGTTITGTLDITFIFTATNFNYAFTSPSAAVWIDVADDAHLLTFPSLTATGTSGSIVLTGDYFPQIEEAGAINKTSYHLFLTVKGTGTALIQIAIAGTDSGVISYTGTLTQPSGVTTISG